MNIFFLDRDLRKAAEYHCDKHVVKMIVESAQMISTAHWFCYSYRIGIGEPTTPWGKHWVKVALYDADRWGIDVSDILEDEEAPCLNTKLKRIRDRIAKANDTSIYAHVYSPTHANHPSAVWARSNLPQYETLCELSIELCREYTKRYGRKHKTEKLIRWAAENAPPELKHDALTDPPQCMPDEYKCEDTVAAYRAYYLGEKARFAKWRYTTEPSWWNP